MWLLFGFPYSQMFLYVYAQYEAGEAALIAPTAGKRQSTFPGTLMILIG